MNRSINPRILPWLPMAAGAVGLALRAWFLTAGVDDRGLLVRFHPGEIGAWVLTAAVLVLTALAALPLSGRPRRPFPPSPIFTAGLFAAAVGIAVAGGKCLADRSDGVVVITGVIGLAAGLCLALLGWQRLRGGAGLVWLYLAPAIFLPLYLICQYRRWSWASQLSVYIFPMLAMIFLMLAAYYRVALILRLSGRRRFVFFSQAAGFFCLLSVPGGDALFYLTMAVWMFTGLCSMRLVRPREAP